AQPRDPMSADAKQRPGEEFAARSRGENATRRLSSQQGDKESFDFRNRFASESVSYAQDDRVKSGAQDDRVKSSAQDDKALREQLEREAAYRKFTLEL